MARNFVSSPKTYYAMAAFMAFDAVIYAIPLRLVTEGLDAVNFPHRYRWIFPPIKAAAAIGLCSVARFPALARLTTVMLTIYFALAVGSHARARDLGSGAASASTLLALFAAMAATRPHGR
ncbi:MULTISPECIES: DoxX family protein [Mycolicibacter]|uniref:DoxX family protein n=1 Tax=Mycolicibacter kumamotonensis TaxID=354243 RepID=A0A7K3L7M0_9MYCO|nr:MULTISPECIES: DoxX family protein [Mycolicibacter]NDJ88130.1 hypothetical protein [Mycolicibacter kumamotonensis]RAV03859.1 hypothetical protein DQP56_01260 [Mycolicibacter senuensis]